MKIIKSLGPVIAIILFICGTIYYDFSQGRRRKKALDNYDLSFGGVVIAKKKLNSQGQGGIVVVKMEDKKNNYDYRNEEFYLCIIRNDTAEIATTYFNSYNLSDSIYVDGQKKEIFIFEGSKLKEVIPVFMVDDVSPFGIEVRKAHGW